MKLSAERPNADRTKQQLMNVVKDDSAEELQKILSFYEKTVLEQYFPYFTIDGNSDSYMYVAGERNTSLPALYYNKNLYRSPYFLEGKTDYIHYTSLEAAYNIIKTQELRLNELTQVNDPKEVSYIKELVGEIDFGPWNFWVHDDLEDNGSKSVIDRLKERIYTLSLCSINDIEQPDAFGMWNRYGSEGNGVALVLKLDDINRFDWYNFHLTKVYYGKEEAEALLKYIKQHSQFLRDNEVTMNEFDAFVAPFLAAHKSEHYSDECEVRLLTKYPNYYMGDGIEEDFCSLFNVDCNLNLKNGFRNCINLKLRNGYDFRTFKRLRSQNVPAVKLEKVILGYKYDELFRKKLERVLNGFNRKNGQPLIKVEISRLKEELGFK